MRHPQWKIDTPTDELAAEESLNDSLKDVQDMSLRLSIDGERTSLNESIAFAPGNDPDLKDQVKRALSKMKRPETGAQDNYVDKKMTDIPSKYPMLRRRRKLIVIALDCYDSKGMPEKKMICIIQEIFKAVKLDPQTARMSGFALSTAMPMSELTEFLKSGNVKVNDYEYYPGTYTEENGKLYPDPDYASHIEYRWGSNGLKKTIWKLVNTSEDAKLGHSSTSIEQDAKSSNSHCLSYLIKDPIQAKKVDDMRQKLRMRGLRCHLMYCRNSTRMQVIPLLASRAQALRYLFVLWRLNVANMYVILGETGDTDYEELIAGAHKTLINEMRRGEGFRRIASNCRKLLKR